MNECAHIPEPDEAPAEVAARWFSTRRRHFDAPEEEQFTAWLESDPVHRKAYEEVTRSWEIAGEAGSDPDLISMRSEALMMRPEHRREYPRLWGALATAAMLLLVMSGVYIADPLFPHRAMQSFEQNDVVLRTGIGERATATLEDGSSVVLNTNSTLEVNYSKSRRDVRLLEGQVLFKVAHDADRPFVVFARDRQIVALGTKFEVRLDGSSVRVALLKGKVRVQPLDSAVPPSSEKVGVSRSAAILSPGEQLLVSSGGEMTVKSANVEDLVSWKTGRIRFDDTPLAEAVAEMNRYSRTPIVIADPAIAKLRISGAFRTGQSRSFAEAVTDAFPVEAEHGPDLIRLEKRS